VVASSLPRLRGFAVSARTFRLVALGNVLWLFVIVASGASVRLTDSGLGCLDWPGCTAGAFVPKNGFHSYVEFSNRIVSGVAVFLTLGTWIVALLTRSARPWVRWVAGAAFLGTAAEAPLGKITVDHNLNPWLVGTHFLLAIVVLGLGVLVLLEAWGVRSDAVPAWMRRTGLVVAAACAVLVVTGTLASAAGPHSGSVAVPRVWRLESAVWLHVRATAVFAILFVLLLTWAARRGLQQVRAGLVVAGVLATQMVVGEVQYRNHLPWWLVLIHVTLAAGLWASTAAFVALLWRPRRRLSAPTSGRPGSPGVRLHREPPTRETAPRS
jgi:cytochrome c oxidase assembly protein subunit 15